MKHSFYRPGFGRDLRFTGPEASRQQFTTPIPVKGLSFL